MTTRTGAVSRRSRLVLGVAAVGSVAMGLGLLIGDSMETGGVLVRAGALLGAVWLAAPLIRRPALASMGWLAAGVVVLLRPRLLVVLLAAVAIWWWSRRR
jgi:hypothetical protein